VAREMVVNCDVCGKPGASEWTVGRTGDGHWTVDLCTEHAEVVQGVADKGRPVQPSAPGRPRTRYDRYVRGLPPLAARTTLPA
jgi:hypothetical protein